ncbi:uncharacterized protein A1O9_12439 [Exophiala aquamarina CBS 119918]|uniref:ATP-grasp domain-containing protein n=1 Tax=Exophiala aquamarina CBS 119918 TaxID=1182545 RepID=A0A072NVU3_9EURO|nr:uncharacterized protein A1O9_12439 [Exophiala aquamarina CBS 119918]KEF51522.1 hypothetical protein A1O9_12439 [Exophiala aquamarina CBS 119918]
MLDASSSVLLHRLQGTALIAFSIVFLPLDTSIFVISYLLSYVFHNICEENRKIARSDPNFKPRNVLVTGVGMTKGLVLARAFYEAGHNVVGADFEANGSLVCGRVSKSLRAFRPLRRSDVKNGASPYIQSLLDIILKEKIEIWVSCSGVASATEDGIAKEIIEVRTNCKAIQFDLKTTEMLHEKHSFIEHTRSLGLNVPETHEITSRSAVENLLRNSPEDRKFIMKTIRMDDSARADMTLLPKATPQETSKHIAKLKISEKTPWILQQFIEGREYCTHSLVVNGKVRAFVACPSAELLMHYEALPHNSTLSQAMLAFTKKYASNGGPGFTGHLSFDFMVEASAPSESSGEIVLYPIECNPRAHTAVALFGGTPGMICGYLSILDDAPSLDHGQLATPRQADKYCWVGHDLVTMVVLPSLAFFTLHISFPDLISSYKSFLEHLFLWKDATYEMWDPLPWWWLYHVYWPMQFLSCIRAGKKWSRINVSTTKMFEC